jgi:hypothetical protein
MTDSDIIRDLLYMPKRDALKIVSNILHNFAAKLTREEQDESMIYVTANKLSQFHCKTPPPDEVTGR